MKKSILGITSTILLALAFTSSNQDRKKKNLIKMSLSGAVLLLMLFSGACKKDEQAASPQPSSPTAKSSQIYVANEDDGSVSVINASDNKVAATIDLTPVGGDMLMPHNIQVAPDGKSVWVTGAPMMEGGMEYIVVIDPLTNKVIKHIQAGVELHLAHVVLDSASKNAFITCNESNQVLQYDASTYSRVKTFDLDTAHKPHGLRYFNGKLYVANMDAKSLSIIDVASGQISETALGGVAVQTAVTPDGKYIFASLYDTKEVVRYEMQSGTVTRIALPNGSEGPIQLYPTPDSKFIYVCDQGNLLGRPASNKVYVIDISNSQIVNTITAGNAAHGVVVSKDGKSAYVTNSADNSLSVIDIASKTIKATVSTGKAPNGVSYWYETGGMP